MMLRKQMSTVFALALMTLSVFAHALTKDTRIDLDANGVPLSEALVKLFNQVDYSYVLQDDLNTKVTARLKEVEFEDALKALLKKGNATYRIEGNIYLISKRPNGLTAFNYEPFMTTPKSGDAPLIYTWPKGGDLPKIYTLPKSGDTPRVDPQLPTLKYEYFMLTPELKDKLREYFKGHGDNFDDWLGKEYQMPKTFQFDGKTYSLPDGAFKNPYQFDLNDPETRKKFKEFKLPEGAEDLEKYFRFETKEPDIAKLYKNARFISLSFADAANESALKSLFTAAGKKYRIVGDLKGDVTCEAQFDPSKPEEFNTALSKVLDEANARYRIEKDVYVIEPKSK